MIRKGKVIVAMSGGVDSSTAAAILKNRGYNVVGVFMKFWTPQERGRHRRAENLCCSAKARMDAKRVAIKLNIPFYVLNAQKEFKKRVVDYLIREYKRGNTPNPCVMCNKYIKFKFLSEKMIEIGVDFIATGHYARIKFVNSRQIRYSLMMAKDKTKDQSYFLWTLNQNQLKKILFPIGDYTKTEVRGMAKKFGLPVYEKKDSQEICFIDTCIEDFLRKYIKTNSGQILTTAGKKIGEHEGLIFYTIGQRKGIKIGGIGPFYVVKKDFKNNALIVAQGDFDETLYKKEMTVSNVNWINKPSKFPFKCKVKIRYGHKAIDCKIYKIPQVIRRGRQATKYKIHFSAPQRAITPGQSAVFYLRNEVLGGGVIE